MILTASLFPFACFGVGFILNTIAIFYGTLAAIPFGTMVVVLVIWAFISFPLALLGTVVGRNWNGAPNNPCRVKTIPRPIPDKKWYLTPSVISLMGGLLPFGSIFIEMYFVFTSFWHYKVTTPIPGKPKKVGFRDQVGSTQSGPDLNPYRSLSLRDL